MTQNNTLNLKHFRLEYNQPDNIAWLYFDHASYHGEVNEKSQVNTLTSEALEELDQVLDHFSHTAPAGLVICSGKKTGFIAGANINDFSNLNNPDKTLAMVARGWRLFHRLANVPYPTLALISGHCMGGGLELALTCRYRLAIDKPDTVFALPEVRLGIFPGWGGIRRLPRIIGPQAALPLMLTGKTVKAGKALKLGIIDAIVPERIMRQAANQLILSGKPRRQANTLQSILNSRLLKPFVASKVSKSIARKDPNSHYPAPQAILDIWQHHDGNPLNAPDIIESLTRSSTTANLLRVYSLQERLKSQTSSSSTNIKRVHVIGAGVMGGDIAALCALKGFKVTLQDNSVEQISSARGRAFSLFQRRLENPLLVQEAFDRLIPDINGYGIPHADIVIEAIAENLNAKQQLYELIEPQLKDTSILASNTSSLSINDLATSLKDPTRFIGMHFFNPVSRMPLVEIIAAKNTTTEVQQQALIFTKKLGKLPLPVDDQPGFLVNAVLAPYMLEAMICVDEGYSPQAIDAAMLKFGMPMGPLELADTVGLDIIFAVANQLGDSSEIPKCLQDSIKGKHFGKKTGQGFYKWSAGKPDKDPTSTAIADVSDRLVQSLIDKATECVEKGVVSDADLADAGVIFGTGFAPFTGGPLHYSENHYKA